MISGADELSKIVVTVSENQWPATARFAFKRFTGISLPIKASAAGAPILEVRLFMNDHPAIALMLRALIALDRAEQLELGYYELEPEEPFSEAPLAACQITADILERILGD